MNKKIKGIVFDMDNTLLRSNIDFENMKNETFQFLSAQGLVSEELNLNDHTCSTIIEEAMKSGLMTEDLIEHMWEIPKKYEMAGMHNAKLELGVKELLEDIKGKYHLVILTNNSVKAAEIALRDNGIFEYFDYLMGREMMKSIKPSPDGFLKILSLYNDTLAEEWISVGDAWIDGKASIEAGIKFISYKGDVIKMNRAGVFPSSQIMDIRELMHFL